MSEPKSFEDYMAVYRQKPYPGDEPVKYASAFKTNGVKIAISNDMAMDVGLIPDTRPAPEPPSPWRRFRWWSRDKISVVRYRAGVAIGSWVAGVSLNEEDW